MPTIKRGYTETWHTTPFSMRVVSFLKLQMISYASHSIAMSALEFNRNKVLGRAFS